ncbi:hypothetical protein BS50DRAFT_662592 [Corynespora cassiicola Philippines]|uniref:Homeodomain-like protein n=1 Tax=Corynespora cassiicola Philippines TaxID=1448308 RepID=A0A2T2NZ56_CORCC|nr:hypothetical protein BS50DRAFT_662592 [Corynespora cassiicola Philippines]
MAALNNRRKWSPEEDKDLRDLVMRYGTARGSQSRWKDIADHMTNRTPKDCRKRWFHSLDPSLKKGRWTEHEDRILLENYARLGPAWHDIALLIPGRKDDQCSKRYMEILGPSAKDRLKDWTPNEDRVLHESVMLLGRRWSNISARLPGRPPLTCRNRWRTLAKRVSSISYNGNLIPSTQYNSSSAASANTDLAMEPTIDPPIDLTLDSTINLDWPNLTDSSQTPTLSDYELLNSAQLDMLNSEINRMDASLPDQTSHPSTVTNNLYHIPDNTSGLDSTESLWNHSDICNSTDWNKPTVTSRPDNLPENPPENPPGVSAQLLDWSTDLHHHLHHHHHYYFHYCPHAPIQ